ncbi:hypothetical protein JI58_03580 [Marinosulfonomonas sp. PRT-SC04]|nr:hypothetical protein JI58_03580 [Marinosulfonomonas sp. PRT-SC04]
MPFKAVMFDMDGLLLDTERQVVACFNQTTADLKLENMSNVATRLIGLRADACEGIIETALNEQVPIAVFHRHWQARIKASHARGIPLKADVIELLERLRSMGLPCAVATSTDNMTAQKHLEMAGILHYFQSITGGDQVECAKPDPEIYHAAAASLGLHPHDCAAFEDSDPGTMAAIASGACTAQIPDINPPAEKMLDLGHAIAPTLLAGAKSIGLIT